MVTQNIEAGDEGMDQNVDQLTHTIDFLNPAKEEKGLKVSQHKILKMTSPWTTVIRINKYSNGRNKSPT